jgi:hypothetical protein
MKKIFVTLTFVFILLNVFAQKNFSVGYIITNTNEKIEGEINDLDWRINPSSIEFRKNSQSSVISYSANSINEFSVNERVYWGRVVKLDQSSHKSEDLLKGKNLIQNVIDTVFLEVLLSSKVSLLYALTKNDKPHFLYEKDGLITELIVKKTVISNKDDLGNNTKQVVVTSDLYKGQLTALMKDCPEVQELINKLKLSTKDLQKLFSKYLGCVGEDIKVFENSNKTKTNWGITAGGFFSSLKFDPPLRQYPENQFNAIGLPVGISADIVLAKNRGKISIYNEAIYNRFDYEYNDNPLFKFSQFRINSMFRISTVDKGGVRIFGNAGIGFGFILSADTPFDNYRKNDNAINIGTGLKYKKLSLEGRYERSTGFNSFTDIQDRISSYYILINFQLNKYTK